MWVRDLTCTYNWGILSMLMANGDNHIYIYIYVHSPKLSMLKMSWILISSRL